MSAAWRRHKLLVGLLAVVVLLAAVPLTAYVIVPQFVRSTLVEGPPTARGSFSPLPGSADSPGVGASSSPAPRTLLTGSLRRINAVDFGSGTVSVIDVGGDRFVRFEGVEIAAAPAQHVYLSDRTDGRPGAFRDLGPLKATSGSFNYTIPADVDLGRVGSVASWCVQFNSTVTYAVLAPV